MSDSCGSVSMIPGDCRSDVAVSAVSSSERGGTAQFNARRFGMMLAAVSCPTALRFDLGVICLPLVGVLIVVGCVYFFWSVKSAFGRRAWSVVILGLCGIYVSVMPLTWTGFRIAQYLYFYRVVYWYDQQVSAAVQGGEIARHVAGARAHVLSDPFQVAFVQVGFLSNSGVVYCPQGAKKVSADYIYSLHGDWYWCGWD